MAFSMMFLTEMRYKLVDDDGDVWFNIPGYSKPKRYCLDVDCGGSDSCNDRVDDGLHPTKKQIKKEYGLDWKGWVPKPQSSF